MSSVRPSAGLVVMRASLGGTTAQATIVLVTNHMCRAASGGLCPSPLCELESQVGNGLEC